MRLGDAEVAVHVLGGGLRVVEITTIEALLGLPETGLGAFLASLPGTDRVRFLVGGKERFGLPATKIPEMLNAYFIANPHSETGNKAFEILRALVMRGLREAGQNPEAADFLMAAAMPPKGPR